MLIVHPVSCDHGIVHLDCWSIKIFSFLDGFVRFEFYPFLIVGIIKYFPFGGILSGILSFGAFAFVHPCICGFILLFLLSA